MERGPNSGVPLKGPSLGVAIRSPVPPIVSIKPVSRLTIRKRWLPISQISKLPRESKAILWGCLNWARTAIPPSPENPGLPLPASVVTTPDWRAIRCTQWLSRSTM